MDDVFGSICMNLPDQLIERYEVSEGNRRGSSGTYSWFLSLLFHCTDI